MDVTFEDFECVDPNPASVVESLRSIGYTLEAAIADLIDNSITANCTRIDIDGPYTGLDTKISILDNGDGMTEEKLVEAMRLGSCPPSVQRDKKDLGRFGLGLKTATFSQCKKLTVATKKNGKVSARCWDLDLVVERNQWYLLKNVPQEYIDKVDTLRSGTLIVWEKLDRVISEKDKNAEKNFNNKKSILRRHLSLTFHRFIERGKLTVNIAGVSVVPWNPFLPYCSSAFKKELPETVMCEGNVVIRGMVMPHRNYFKNDEEYKEAGFRKGWTQMQGFYIYRADRLLTAGGWLGLKPDGTTMIQEHHYDLARICIDITNGYDFDWDIDIKKSKATPPDYLRDILGQIAKKVRRMAYETYSYRGTKSPALPRKGTSFIPLWNSVKERNGKLYYSLNNDHPLVSDILSTVDKESAKKVKMLLKLIAETIPAENISFESSKSDSKKMSSPYETEPKEYADIKALLIQSYIKKGLTQEEAEEQADLMLNM